MKLSLTSRGAAYRSGSNLSGSRKTYLCIFTVSVLSGTNIAHFMNVKVSELLLPLANALTEEGRQCIYLLSVFCIYYPQK